MTVQRTRTGAFLAAPPSARPTRGGALARHWPALAGAALATAVPLGVALAAAFPEGITAGPGVFTADPMAPDGRGVRASATGLRGYGVEGRGSLAGVRGQVISGTAHGASEVAGVEGEGPTGVRGLNSTAAGGGVGVHGVSLAGGGVGVRADAPASNGIGVRGASSDTGTGVRGAGGTGVRGEGTGSNGVGVRGEGPEAGVDGSSGRMGGRFAGTGSEGIGIHSQGTDTGVHGQGTGPASVGVFGLGAASPGPGGSTPGPDGIGVWGIGDTGVRGGGRVGGQFGGTQAPLRLVPSSSVGPPTGGVAGGAHEAGELYVDSQGQLFLCTAAGTPGTWVQVAVTPVK